MPRRAGEGLEVTAMISGVRDGLRPHAEHVAEVPQREAVVGTQAGRRHRPRSWRRRAGRRAPRRCTRRKAVHCIPGDRAKDGPRGLARDGHVIACGRPSSAWRRNVVHRRDQENQRPGPPHRADRTCRSPGGTPGPKGRGSRFPPRMSGLPKSAMDSMKSPGARWRAREGTGAASRAGTPSSAWPQVHGRVFQRAAEGLQDPAQREVGDGEEREDLRQQEPAQPVDGGILQPEELSGDQAVVPNRRMNGEGADEGRRDDRQDGRQRSGTPSQGRWCASA